MIRSAPARASGTIATQTGRRQPHSTPRNSARTLCRGRRRAGTLPTQRRRPGARPNRGFRGRCIPPRHPITFSLSRFKIFFFFENCPSRIELPSSNMSEPGRCARIAHGACISPEFRLRPHKETGEAPLASRDYNASCAVLPTLDSFQPGSLFKHGGEGYNRPEGRTASRDEAIDAFRKSWEPTASSLG